MLSLHLVELIVIGTLLVLAVLGGMFYSFTRGGWMKNGYFNLPAVILIVIVLFVLFQGLGSGITLGIIGEHIENHPIAALSINGLAEILVLLIGSVLISRAMKQDPFAVFRLEGFWETPPTAYLLAIPIILIAQIGGSAVSVLVEHVWKYFPTVYQPLQNYENTSDTAVQGLVTAHNPLDLLLIFLFVAIVPAFSEETLFRGFAQTNIERSGHRHTRPYTALIIASILFAMMHASVFKFPGLFALGLTLGWLTYRTNNLFTGAFGHAINNGFIVAALYLSPERLSTTANLAGTEEMSGKDALIVLVPIVIAMILLLALYNRITAPLQARKYAEQEFESRLAHEHPVLPEVPPNEHHSDPYE
jgi:membrane protease YdiL (CAAX protease family)